MSNSRTVSVLTETNACRKLLASTYHSELAIHTAFAQAGRHYLNALRAGGGSIASVRSVVKQATPDDQAAASITPDEVSAIVALIEAIAAAKNPAPTPSPSLAAPPPHPWPHVWPSPYVPPYYPPTPMTPPPGPAPAGYQWYWNGAGWQLVPA